MKWINGDLILLIKKYAELYHVEPSLVAAIISAESNGDRYAIRYEPNFKYLYKENKMALLNRISVETEITLQKCSIGLTQCMGCIVRELNFTGNLLRLTESELAIEYGCKKLRQLADKYSVDSDVISAYNCGSVKTRGGPYTNPEYVLKVLSIKRKIKDLL